MSRWPLVFAGISGAVMVAVGAYASHASLEHLQRVWLETGAQYGLWHSLALLGVGVVARDRPGPWLRLSAIGFAAGIALFSGTLFVRVFMDWQWVAMAAPVGGFSFIAGWLLLAVHGATARSDRL